MKELYSLLTELCESLALDQHVDSERLFELTRQGSGPAELVRLAEAFGMMLVRVEARDFHNVQLLRELQIKNAELEALRRVLVQENEDLKKDVAALRPSDDGIIGQSEAMRHVFELARVVAMRPVNTLILGATGTGKEVVARYLHRHSPRRDKPFVAVNCSAIPDTLFESAMFGIEKGVATGVDKRKGFIEEADGGTLFLDELADMSLAHQAKLLRVLEEGEVTRVGSVRPVPVDINLICATNADLEKSVREGRFREDLFYRINVVELNLPPLCERGDDILLLAQAFLERHCAKMQRKRLALTQGVQALLLRYPWPGNVRELDNEMKRAAAIVVSGDVQIRHLSPRLLRDKDVKECLGVQRLEVESRALPLNLREAETMLIRRALKATRGHKGRTAELLGITREGLRKKMQKMEEEAHYSEDDLYDSFYGDDK